VRVKPASLLFAPGKIANSENIVQDGQEMVAFIAMNTLHILTCSFIISSLSNLVTHLANFFENWRSVKRGMNYFSWHVMGLSEFPDTLSPIILHFSSDIGSGSLSIEVSLVWFSFFAFWIIAYLNVLQLFLAAASDFMKLL
jgi:hypothetical protein